LKPLFPVKILARSSPRLLFALGLLCLATAAVAEDEAIYFSDLPVVASVSRLPQRLADAPTAVTVIDRDIIKASGARDLNDIFRLVPGFQTYPNTTESARVSYHGMGEGEYGARVQVLIDGRSMYSPLFGGGVNWATLPVALDDIERIEVVRGTNAVSYGSNAFLGVINIITVDPALTHGLSLSTSYGNQNVRDYNLRLGGKVGEVGDFRFTFKQQSDDGLANRYDWGDSYFSRLVDLRADFSLSDQDSLQVSLGQVEGVSQVGRLGSIISIPGLPPIDGDPIRDLKQKDIYVQLLWRRVFSPGSDLQVRYSYVEDRSSDAFSVSIPGQSYVFNQSGDEGVRHEIEVQHSLKMAASTRLAWGASWRDDGTRSKWALPGQGMVHRDVSRLFGNLEWKPVRWFTGNVGIAGENDSLAGFHLSPRLSGNFHLNSENTLRLGVSRAYRNGSTVDYLGNVKVIVSNAILENVFQGTRSLPSERLDTMEIGYLGDWRDWRASLDVRLFSEKIYDRLFRIDLGTGKTFPDTTLPDATVPIQNIHIYGVEYQFKWQPFENTRLLVNQAFTRADADYLASALGLSGSTLANASDAQKIDYFTEHSMPRRSSSLLLMQRLPFGLDFSIAGYWQDMMKWTTNTTSTKYHRYDARLGYPFRFSGLRGEIAFTVQSLNGDHFEYKSDSKSTQHDGRIVERRQWLSLRLDY
jgi:iron complex outermembrane recepter protein